MTHTPTRRHVSPSATLALGTSTLLLAVFAASAHAITIPTVPVGNAGNANDPATGGLYGGVAYAYRIGTTEVTVGQYTEFLNAVAAADTYALYDTRMATNLNIAGISRTGSSGSYTYSVIGSANHPVTYVSWGDAARFANWLHNGQPTGAQDATTTEDGAYALNGAITNAALNAVTRNSGAHWFIPTESEWYKAAYYQPAAQGGDSDDYWAYPTGTNAVPTSIAPPGGPNSANFRDPITGDAVTGSMTYSASQNYLTDVGAYTSSASYYGTDDQGGNLWEWNETLFSGISRKLRGGSWVDTSIHLAASTWGDDNPADQDYTRGFRVATVPEPSTAVLAIVACALMWFLRRRFK